VVERHVGVLGARSFVGECLLALLVDAGYRVTAFSRQPDAKLNSSLPGITWRTPNSNASSAEPAITHWVCLAPIWTLPQYLPWMKSLGAERIVAVSSTSRFTKTDSSDMVEQLLAQRLASSEQQLVDWAQIHGVEWCILRPTLIYGFGQDKNVSEIARFIRRFGFFPLLGAAGGLRQPVHVDDVAKACLAAMTVPTVNRPYAISGGETLAYRDMVARIFAALDRRPRLLTVPLWAFSLAVTVVRRLPRYRQWSAAMAERMNLDLVFDHGDAARDLGYTPRRFLLLPADLPE
jgi:nucleoside-diphosphate-sugar epimerase